jgi:multimeric flavodoxin WrbA
MKTVAVNGSPHADKGNTALLLKPFLKGIEDAGSDVKVFYTKKLKINPCQGEYHCWLKKPGKCYQEDDMAAVLPELIGADVLVLATPVYVDGMTGPMKNFLDRIIPIGEPFIELREGHCRHPGRGTVEDGKLVLVSSCGFWELDNFDPLLAHVKAVGKNIGRAFAGALLRPHGAALRAMKEQGAPVGDIFEAAEDAGRQLVRDGCISAEMQSVVSRELLPLQQYIDISNRYMRNALDKTR